MVKNAVIVLLSCLSLWLSVSLVEVENQRYALLIGICGDGDPAIPSTLLDREECLERVETRTNPFWHLAYGLGVV